MSWLFPHLIFFRFCLSGFNKRIEYEPGTGSLALFPSIHLETCDEPIASIQASVELETNHIGKGCDRDTYSEKSLHKLCGTLQVSRLQAKCGWPGHSLWPAHAFEVYISELNAFIV